MASRVFLWGQAPSFNLFLPDRYRRWVLTPLRPELYWFTEETDPTGLISSFYTRAIVTVQSQAPSQLRGQAQAPFVALEVRLALAVDLLFHAPRSKCEVLTEQLRAIK